MTARTNIFRADLSGTAFGGTPTWTDLSAYILAEGQGEPVSITWGRQDEESDVTPSTMSIVLDNVDGRFTPDRAASPYYPHVLPGFRGNFRQIVNGVTYDRFDGYCDEIAQAWPGGSEGWSVVRLTFTDVTARLAQDQPLRALVDYEMLALSPSWFYPLSEAAGATSAADISSNALPPAPIVTSANGPWPVTFGQSMSMLDSATGVGFGAYNGGSKASVLQITGTASAAALPPAAGGHTQIMWLVAPSSIPSAATPNLTTFTGPSGSTPYAVLGVNPGTDGRLNYLINDGTNSSSADSVASICDGGLHMVAVTLESDQKTTKLYLDGSLEPGATSVAAAAISLAGLKRVQIGGLVTESSNGASFPGVLGRVALYPTALTAAQILTIYQAGVGQNTERSDLRFSRLAGYGRITTAGLPTGQATMGGQKTAGRTALDCLKDVGRTENSPVFADGTGALTFQARNFRYQPAASVTLNTANHDVDPDLSPRKDRQGLINDITVTRDGGAAQRVQNSVSQSAYGRADAGSYTVSSSTDDDALQAANWQIGKHKDAALRVPSLTVDLLTQPTTAQTQAVLALGVSEVISLTGLPANAPATSMSLFVEGGRETIGLQAWEIEFYTSPVTVEAHLWVLEDPTFGVIDSTNLIAF